MFAERISPKDRQSGATTGGAIARPVLAAMALGLAACNPVAQSNPAAPAVSPELYEFANMRQSNIIPKSSPSAFVRAFDSFCLQGGKTAAAVAQKLRAKDYVAAPRLPGSQQTAFVVDDSRPMVVVADNGKFCAVAARSRTGQTAKVRAFVARRFGSAPAVEHALPGVEMLRRSGGANAGLIVLKRRIVGVSGSQLVLAIQRDN
jgi:hypothetical protein